jgi:hypothetical protein
VSSGTVRYLWPSIPTLWRSAVWFPLAAGLAVAALARIGRRTQLPSRPRGRIDAVRGVLAVLALYALTAFLRGQPAEVSVTLCGALALGIWSWWDPSWPTFALACLGALLGTLGGIGCVKVGAVVYANDSNTLAGVAPWLPCVYFAAASLASGLWRSAEGGQE